MTIEVAKKLTERLEQNMDDFMSDILTYDKKTIISMLPSISEMNTAYELIAAADFEDETAEYLLQFKNPIEIVADEFVAENDYADGYDFLDFIYDFVQDENDENLDVYPLVSELDTDTTAICEAFGLDMESLDKLLDTITEIIELLVVYYGACPKE